jgi:proteasome lid subunit RPN8/RPN11|tara:strand:- start:7 stop:336 length:330 start_codon:yes stop_codon:yes gene_type:complete
MNYLAKLKRNKFLFNDLKSKSLESEKEICGFVLNGKFVQRTNMHPDPVNHFLISPKECIWGEDVVVFHSHPSHVEEKGFSEWDLENQKFFYMDMLLYSVNEDEFYFKEK